MKFRLVEELEDSILYHCSDTKFDSFRDNEQGSHFCFTPTGAKDVSDDKLDGSKHVYIFTCQYMGELNPLYVNIDTQYWGAEAIAEMLLAKKYGNITVWASDRESKKDEYGNLLARNITSEEIDIDPEFINSISEEDTKLLKYFNDIRKSKEFNGISKEDMEGLLVKNFKDLAKWLENKGFNCLIYPLAESKSRKDDGVLIFDNTKVKILKIEQVR